MNYNSIASSINYFNSLISNQLLQDRLNNNINGQSGANNQQASALNSALSSLAGLLSASKSGSASAQNISESNVAYTVEKLTGAGADMGVIQNLLGALSGDTGDILFTRTGSSDPNITLQNRQSIQGADLQSFLTQASRIAQRGENIDQYLETATNVITAGDYDDFRRFINVTDTVIYRGGDLGTFYDFTNDVLNQRHYDMESNIFSVQTMMNYGASLDTAITIMENMEHIGLNGRNNMVDLNRVTIDARNKGAYLPYVFEQMAASGDTRAFMDAYMAENGMKTTAPDFNKFDRIERIDGEDMVITQGESAALFAQAISSRDGLLPESVLYWSSMETGAMSHGSSYLDLSTLGPGTYEIYVKIGNYGGGTDTAKKTVIVLPNDSETENIKSNNGLGDTKDADNQVKFADVSNPGQSKFNTGITEPAATPVNPPVVAPPEIKTEATAFIPPDVDMMSAMDKMMRLYELFKDKVSAGEVYDFLDEHIGKNNIIDFLNNNGQSALASAYEQRDVKWLDMLLAQGRDSGFYDKSTAFFRQFVAEEQAEAYFLEKKLNEAEAQEALWLLGYRDTEVSEPEDDFSSDKTKSNNGLGDTKDTDNQVKFADTSNPGKNKFNDGATEPATKPFVVEDNEFIAANQAAANDEPEIVPAPVIEPPALNPAPPANLRTLAGIAHQRLATHLDEVEQFGRVDDKSFKRTESLYLNKIFDKADSNFQKCMGCINSPDENQDVSFILRFFSDILEQIYRQRQAQQQNQPQDVKPKED